MTKAEVKQKFAQTDYPIQVIGRHVSVTEPMKNYAVEKLKKAKRFGGRIIEATITMDIQKLVHLVDFSLNVNNIKVKVSGSSENMYTSVDLAIAHLESKLRKYMARLHEHRGVKPGEIEMNVAIVTPLIDDINDQIEEENLKTYEDKFTVHEVVAREKRALPMLTQKEAILRMELAGDLFMIYKSEEDQKLKVLYRRNDGNYGIIEPEA